jgi:glycosyltransferase involved in cell wall biosynthesis
MSTVSVIIPAYNQAHYLSAAVHSVLTQTHDQLEVIVVDDGSTDRTRDVVERISDPRVRYVHQQNAGLSAARNTGIRHARGDFLSYLDSDDLFLPDKLRVLLGAFDQNPALGFAAGQSILIDEAGQLLGEVFDKGLPEDTSDLLLHSRLF